MTNPKMRSIGKTRLPTTDFRYDNDLCLVTPTSKPQYDAEFSKLLVGWRKLLEMTQSELAEESGYSERTIRRWENGESAPRKIDRMRMETTLEQLQSRHLGRHASRQTSRPLPAEQTEPDKKLSASTSDKPATTKEARTLSKVENKKVSKTVSTKTSKKSKEKKYDCTTCPLNKVSEGQTPFSQFVDGYGECENGIFILAEAPGETETQTKIPLTGNAGKELDKLLEIAGIEREKCRITNVVKCHPPGNRDPNTKEIRSCRRLLDEELAKYKPTKIITLGKFALEAVRYVGFLRLLTTLSLLTSPLNPMT